MEKSESTTPSEENIDSIKTTKQKQPYEDASVNFLSKINAQIQDFLRKLMDL